MDIDCQEMFGSESDYIEMRDGINEDSPLMGRFCGNETDIPKIIQTSQNNLRIRWTWMRAHVNFLLFSILTGSNQITLNMDLDSNLIMNLLMCPNGAITAVHVVETSRLQMALSHRHLSRTNSLTMLTVSTLSHSLRELISTWDIWCLILWKLPVITGKVTSLTSGMVTLRRHLSWQPCVAITIFFPCNPLKTLCGWG